ncbi:transglycosylase [Caulobacter sp. Root1455]|uniref:murein transglycosylase A n=1 Tax=Caulobacter sp. Root1455 TaxID=1736465 RepID=UPI0006FCB49B|nr:MltA domain-containing protein [Caulobacter sp. Root1455]KQZ05703.1 transglycosylase [Caulobacter sp. Root1455]
MLRHGLVAAFALLALAACTTAPPPPVGAGPIPPPVGLPVTPTGPGAVSFSDLAGWSQEDHLGALDAFRQGCGVAKDPALAEVCRKARAERPGNDDDARRFIEANFRPEPVPGQGLLTAYFAPEYEARMSRSAEFSAPMRGKPDDLVTLDLAQFDPGLVGKKVTGEIEGGQVQPYPDRAAIEATPETRPLAWMRPEDLFFLQIQGSGILVMPDGRRVRAAFAAHNGRPFVGIATPMREKGLLPDNNTSGDAIRGWLADHRGPEADAIMQLNPRYVFFQTLPDDGGQAVGAAGIPLPAGRAIAVDASKHALGELYWLDAGAPKLAGAFPTYRRLAVALDVGGAIKGDVRADLYTGTGPAAGAEAGRVRHDLRLYRLVPRG